MSLFRRTQNGAHPLPAPAAEPLPALAAAAPAGDLPCSATGCTRTTGVACHYTDRRARHCPTAWCPEHAEPAAGFVYCRRHAGLLYLLSTAGSAVLPDLDTRAPSLVEWLARDLGDDLEAALLGTGQGDAVTTEPAHPIHQNQIRERTWERSWRLCRHTGFVHRVNLRVSEENDTEVVLLVDRNEVARVVPPWISARLEGEAVDHDEDARRRARFHESLVVAVRRGLDEAIAGVGLIGSGREHPRAHVEHLEGDSCPLP